MTLLFVTNDASHYRKRIYQLIDSNYNTTFLFGKSGNDGIKQMDVSSLEGNVKWTSIHIIFKGLYWQSNVFKEVFKRYDAFLLIGDTRSLTIWLFCIFAAIIGKRKKVFMWTHGWYGKETIIQTFLKKVFFKLSGGGLFIYGDYAKNLMLMNGFKADSLHVIHNSLDFDNQLKLLSTMSKSDVYENHFNNQYQTLILIGRLNQRKNIPLLLDAINLLREKNEYYNVVFVGDGADRAQLEERAKQISPDTMWFYGACYNEEENANLIYNADLCVIPGDVGLSAIHVMTYGTPCITHNCYKYQGPEFETIKQGVTGDFFEYNDSHSLADCISRWFSQNKDREKIRLDCVNEIRQGWTPQFQISVIKDTIKNN